MDKVLDTKEFNSIKNSFIRHFKLRKTEWFIFMAVACGMIIAMQLFVAFMMPMNGKEMLVLPTIVFFALYIMVRLFAGFFVYPVKKNLAIGFGEKRNRFAIEYLVITFAHIIIVELVILIMLVFTEVMWNIRFNDSVNCFSDNAVLVLVCIAFIEPLFEMLSGNLVEIFGEKAYFLMFALGIGFGAFSEPITKFFEVIVEKTGTDLQKLAIVISTVVIYIALIVANFFMTRKCTVQ